MADSTEQGSTVHDSVPTFERWLSSEEEEQPSRETQPTQEQSPASEPVEAEAPSEEAEAEGESEETAEEQTPEAAEETPAPVALDPALKVKVKIDGVETEVTLDEALKGYSRTSDYTRKTQAAAAERKAFETEQVAVRGERQKYATYLTQLEQAIQQTSGTEPDWAQLQQTATPQEFAAEYARWQIHSNEMAQLKAEKDRAQAAVVADQQKELETHLAGEHEKLFSAIPEWKDEKAANTERAKMVAYAEKSFGWTQADLEKVTDHRNLLLLRKAMLYDESQAKKPAIQARIDKVRTATPGPASTPKPKVTEETKALQRLAKTGKVDDAAAAFFKMLPD